MIGPRRLLRGLRSRLGRAARRLAQVTERDARAISAHATANPDPLTAFSFDEAMATSGGFAAWLAKRRTERRQFTEPSALTLGLLVHDLPAEAQNCRLIADELMRHTFNFLGSGPFTPHDPTRARRASGYRPIDWFLDPVRDLRFRRDIPAKEWKLFDMRPANADIKYPWELTRCQHFLALAQAYALFRDEGYAREIVDQMLDYIEANPIGIGINWTCTMDVALRAANWCFALPSILTCKTVTPQEWEAIYRHLFATGLFIVSHFENHYEVTSNHYLSNLVGLHILAAEFGDLPAGLAWDAFARQAIEREIEVQILADGADYESSIPYHRLVLELFLGSYRLAQWQNRPLSPGFKAALVRMTTFLEGVLRPDGRMPVIGDADDGRLMIATGYGHFDPGRGGHVLAPAGLALAEDRWIAKGYALEGNEALWECAWWGFDPAQVKERVKTSAASSFVCRFFSEAGLVVAKDEQAGNYLLIANSRVGTNGFGNHKHCDQLSFDYVDRGTALIVDPGSYVYTSDFAARNRFRRTAAHNTVMIDGIDHHDSKDEWLFRFFEKAKPRHEDIASRKDGLVYQGSHDGYVAQLAKPVTHRRRFDYDCANGRLDIRDELTGEGTHRAEWFFHFAPGLELDLKLNETCLLLSADKKAWRLDWQGKELTAALLPGQISPSYGRVEESLILHLHANVDCGSETVFSFNLTRV